MNSTSGGSHSAHGSIRTSRFVKRASGYDFQVSEAVVGDVPYGVSQDGTRYAPGLIESLGGTNSAGPLAAVDGDPLMVFTPGDVCKMKVGVGGCANGDLLKPDSTARGVVASAGDWYGAQALGTALVDELVDVELKVGIVHA